MDPTLSAASTSQEKLQEDVEEGRAREARLEEERTQLAALRTLTKPSPQELQKELSEEVSKELRQSPWLGKDRNAPRPVDGLSDL
tara:strand:+ start:299 stop:553 length:255 start_codon:yes stop_codon:yes gene_type:complete